MAKDARFTNAIRTVFALAVAPEFDDGYLRIYTGTRPAGPSSSATGTLLSEHRFDSTAIASESNGVLTFAAIATENALDDGTAGYARLLKDDGSTAICDISVGTSGANLNLSSLAFTTGTPINITSLTLTVPAQSLA
jgi:hypothetical protein